MSHHHRKIHGKETTVANLHLLNLDTETDVATEILRCRNEYDIATDLERAKLSGISQTNQRQCTRNQYRTMKFELIVGYQRIFGALGFKP